MAKTSLKIKAVEHLDNELMRIRAGKANVHIPIRFSIKVYTNSGAAVLDNRACRRWEK